MTLLCFQTIWPILLIEGITDVKKFQNLVQGQHLDELGQVLYFQAAGKQHFLLFLKKLGIDLSLHCMDFFLERRNRLYYLHCLEVMVVVAVVVVHQWLTTTTMTSS